MFYQDEKGEWKPHTKKITYTKVHTVYDTDDAPYLDNLEFQDLKIEDVSLTPEQSARLEIVRKLGTGIQDIEDYVTSGVVNPENIKLVKLVEDSALRLLILKYIPKIELDNATLTFETTPGGVLND